MSTLSGTRVSDWNALRLSFILESPGSCFPSNEPSYSGDIIFPCRQHCRRALPSPCPASRVSAPRLSWLVATSPDRVYHTLLPLAQNEDCPGPLAVLMPNRLDGADTKVHNSPEKSGHLAVETDSIEAHRLEFSCAVDVDTAAAIGQVGGVMVGEVLLMVLSQGYNPTNRKPISNPSSGVVLVFRESVVDSFLVLADIQV